ncbi:hypothetical protein M9H77_12789 [Catharanthus roseus]|uniref:Uncharacterized protein n=1 Tax=Catharanthus roseus TaxID=4058 RepID=A0ACC0BIB0_CATRO|nr:hypothetical protein M9H77_12789 [Catharanthus roseus]
MKILENLYKPAADPLQAPVYKLILKLKLWLCVRIQHPTLERRFLFGLGGILMRYKLTGPNYFTWKRNLDNLLKSIGYSFVLKNLYLEIEGNNIQHGFKISLDWLGVASGWRIFKSYGRQRSLGSLIEGFDPCTTKFVSFDIREALEVTIKSTEAQLPTPHNGRTNKSPHSNLDPMKVNMQKFQQMRKEMEDMRRDMTNLFMEQRGRSNIGGHVTPHTQRGYGSYNPHVPYETTIQSTHQCYGGGRHLTPRGGDQQVLTTASDIIYSDTISHSGFEYNETERRWITRSGLILFDPVSPLIDYRCLQNEDMLKTSQTEGLWNGKRRKWKSMGKAEEAGIQALSGTKW